MIDAETSLERDAIVRYGRMNAIGRFAAPTGLGELAWGERVVLRTRRGTELGEVLATEEGRGKDEESGPRVLRRAGGDDVEAWGERSAEAEERFEACRRLFEEGSWPFGLVDVEPLLEPGRTVVYYFGPHGLDATGLAEAARIACGLELVMEPVGPDSDWEKAEEPEPEACPSCGEPGGGSCGSSAEKGCSGCAVASAVRTRRRVGG